MAKNPPGPGVDAQGQPVVDPTRNVVNIVDAAVRRLDDLRGADSLRRDEAINHVKEMAALRAIYDTELRDAEAKRIDAIRAVDVQAVSQATTAQEARAATLAAQVTATAETVRTQVTATQAAFLVTLDAALTPIRTDVADLRRVQFQQQGERSANVESRDERSDKRSVQTLSTNIMVGIGLVIIGALALIAPHIH